MGKITTQQIYQAASQVYDADEATEFMTNLHRGAIAKAVAGDADAFIDPAHLTAIERRRLLDYLSHAAAKPAGPM